jgi:hypothetical protein
MTLIAPGLKGKRKGKVGEKEMRMPNHGIQMLLIKNANLTGNENDSYCYIWYQQMI